MKEIIPYLSLFCIMSILMSGCGGEFAGNSRQRAASGSAVSGEAVSGGVVSGEAVRSDGPKKAEKNNNSADMPLESHKYCSANCLYMADHYHDELIQYCVKTNKEKTYQIRGLLSVLFVEKDRVYYTKSLWDGELEEEEDKYRIYSMPIVPNGEGSERLLVEKEECLKDIPELSYEDSHPQMDGDSIYYTPYGSEGMRRYDRKKKNGEIVPLEYCTEVQKLKEKTILYSSRDEKDIRGVWDERTDKMIEIHLPEAEEDSWLISEAPADDGLYYSWYVNKDLARPEVRYVDFSTQETTVFVTESEIKNVLSEKVGIKENTVRRCEVQVDIVGERLYLTLFMEWAKGTCCNVEKVILSRQPGTEGELQYEEGMTECIRKYGEKMREEPENFSGYYFGDGAEDIEEICYNTATFATINEEWACLDPNAEECTDNPKYILFDYKTGKCKSVKKGMPEYYEIYYDCLWGEDYVGEG